MNPLSLLHGFKKPSAGCTTHNMEKIQKVAEAAKAFLRSRAEAFVRQRRHAPLLISYGSDCTPISTLEAVKHAWHEHHVERRGRASHEYLIQRVFLQDVAGETQVHMLDPLPMADKGSWAHFQAFRELLPLGRELGHASLLVSHHCWDRTVCSANDRKQRQLHRAHYEHMLAQDASGTAQLQWLLSWYTCTGCMLHDVQNSLKWSILSYVQDKATMRSCFIACESLRNGFDCLVRKVSEWLPQVIRYEDWGCPDAGRIWTMLNVEPEWVELLTQLQIRWDEGVLKIACAYDGRHDTPQLVATCLLLLWKFRRFSESRWLTLGDSCRALLASELCGLTALVQAILADSSYSSYYLSGFLHMDAQVKLMIGIVATSSCVSDSVLALLLEDDRVPRQLPALNAELLDEFSYVLDLPAGIFQVVAKALGVCAHEPRHRSTASALIQFGFIRHRLLKVAAPPWSLLAGDAAGNLEALAVAPPAEEETTWKIQQLLLLGFCRATLADGLRLLEQANWSSRCVEQGHASASGLMRQHKAYSASSLQARSMCLQMLPLITEDMEQRRLDAALRCLARLRTLSPNHITGRQVYVQDLNATARDMRSRGRVICAKVNNTIIKNHGARWRALRPLARAQYQHRAAAVRDAKWQSLQDRITILEGEVLLRRQRLLARNDCRRPLQLSSARWTASVQRDFCNFFAATTWTQSYVHSLRDRVLQPVRQPPEAYQRILGAVHLAAQADAPRHADWVPFFCWQRDALGSCLVRFTGIDCSSVQSMVYASQKPLLVCFAAAQAVPATHKASSPTTWAKQSLETWEHTFTLLRGTFSYSDEAFYRQDLDIHVMLNVRHLGRGICVSDETWMPLGEVRALLGDGAARAPAAKPEKEVLPAEHPSSWLEHPWLMQHLFMLRSTSGNLCASDAQPRTGREKAARPEADAASGDESCETPEDVLEELFRRRAELLLLHSDVEHFAWTVRGGRWTAENKGVAFDCYVCAAKTAVAADYCCRVALPRSASFSIALYGDHFGLLLAKAWAHRMQWLLLSDPADGCREESKGEQAAKDPYSDPPEMLELLSSGMPAAVKRASAIRITAPKAARAHGP